MKSFFYGLGIITSFSLFPAEAPRLTEGNPIRHFTGAGIDPQTFTYADLTTQPFTTSVAWQRPGADGKISMLVWHISKTGKQEDLMALYQLNKHRCSLGIPNQRGERSLRYETSSGFKIPTDFVIDELMYNPKKPSKAANDSYACQTALIGKSIYPKGFREFLVCVYSDLISSALKQNDTELIRRLNGVSAYNPVDDTDDEMLPH